MIGRIWIVLLVTLLLVIVPPAHTQQQAKIFKIGWLAAGPATGTSLKGFLQEFRNLGYVEDKNIVIESRFANGKLDRLPALADELVGLKVDVLVTGGLNDTLAAKNATKRIPIVFLGPCPIPLDLDWLTAWHDPEEISRGSQRSRNCWPANDWSYSKKPFRTSRALPFCGIHRVE